VPLSQLPGALLYICLTNLLYLNLKDKVAL
jgi:hypothetical protein